MQFLKYKLPAIIWFFIIFALCSMPGKSIPHISWLELLSFDKFVHASIFFVLQTLSMRGFLVSTNYATGRWLILLICVAYGGALEIMQSLFFSERSGDWFDFIANSTGCIIALLIYKSLSGRIAFFRV